ncbi:MAG: FAD-dependent oxidoreductase [Croceibacterium sp.]
MALKAIISGGGIGGLATAAALAQRGWEVTVYESNPGLRVAGSGIYLWSNGLSVLRDIGAYDAVLQNPFWVKGVESRDEKDEVMLPSYVPPGLEILCVARSQLLEGLEQAARSSGVQIRTNEPVVRAQTDATFVFGNGDRVAADLAIGCDGSSSVVRRSLGLEQQHIRMIEGALRTIVPGAQSELPQDQRGIGVETWNGARRFLVSPISEDKIYLAMSCLETDATGRDKRIDESWKQAFPRWRFLLDRIDPKEVLWNTFVIVKSDRWSAGSACILGDAAHAQPPNIGQGGGQAMVNGMALAAHMEQVKDARDIPEALAAWEKAVRPVTDECQRWSTLMSELVTIPNEVRTSFMKSLAQNEWLGSRLVAPGFAKPITKTDWRPNQGRAAAKA